MRASLLLRILVFVAILAGMCESAVYGKDPQTSHEVIAAIAYRASTFVDWPVTDSTTFVFGVIGDQTSFGAIQRACDGKQICNRIVSVIRLQDTSEARKCNAIFVDESETEKLPSALAYTKGLPILTLSDIPSAVERGAMIGLFVADNRVRFSVNIKQSKASKLKLSSRLVQLAKSVIGTN